MTHPGGSFTAEELLEHASFLTGLARELVGDSHAAEDAVQEAFATALERPPSATGSLRGWLAIVTSNLARNARRGGQRRIERERAVARPERDEPGQRALERLDVQRVLIELLRALPEEQRTVLVLRYYEERTPSEIAAQLGAPVKTIKTRHTRAVAELRRRLDERSGGDREAWVSALLPWTRATGAAAVGGSPMLMKLGAAFLAVAATGFVWWKLSEPKASEPVRVAEAAQIMEAPLESSARSSREALPASSAPAASPRATIAVLTGTVRLSEDDGPVVGATVEAFIVERKRATAPRTTTDAAGRFRFEWSEAVTLGSVEVHASSAATGTTRQLGVFLSPRAPTDVELWVTRGATLEATVVDALGAPVAGARVLAWCSAYFDRAKPCERSAVTGGDGRFALERLGEDFVLTAEAPGLVCTDGLRGKLVPGAKASGLRVSMAEACELRGHVMGPDGRSVASASLEVGESGSSSSEDGTAVAGVQRFSPVDVHASSDTNGAFVLAPVPRRSFNVRATHADFLDHHQSVSADAADNRIELDPGYALSGRVSAWSGAPAAGAKVRVRSTGASWRDTTADENGLFELHALAMGENAFVLVEAEGNAVFARQPLVLGPDGTPFLELRLEPPAPLGGRVLDAAGQPLAGALVHVEGERVIDYDGVDFGEKTTIEWATGANEARSDEDGRFRLSSLYAGRFQVRVSPADEPRLWTELVTDAGREDLEIVLDRAQLERVVFSGRVFDALTRQPLRQFTVTPMRYEEGSGRGNNHAFGPEAAGSFRLAGYEAARYGLDVQAVGYAPWKGEPREFLEGETAFEIALAPACAVEVVVRDAKGQPLNWSAQVKFYDLDGRA
ncbi:MAG: sigma-70 family RNA polymerase sigma factor, partial [Planctomycetes bacterium]|nr:sigma-70 family RNA polymerase sigma factor [Planctomycetota bacterium]